MGVPLFVIRDAIRLKGPGLVVLAEAVSEGAVLRVGDAVELRGADGSALVTKVKALPLVNQHDSERRVPISFPSEVREGDVRVGTEVWSHP